MHSMLRRDNYKEQSQLNVTTQSPCAGSGVVRIDSLRFLAGYRKRRVNQALSVLSLSLGFF